MWRFVRRVFPERDLTIMDTPTGNVYSFHQSSFWRFAKFVGKIGLVIWASWSTYVFYYHRPLLQKRTAQLEEARAMHARQVSDMKVYYASFNDLVKGLNAADDKILNAKKLSQNERDALMKKRVNTWAELEFLRTRMSDVFTDADYAPEFTRMSELSVEYELTANQNKELRRQNDQMIEAMQIVADSDSQIVESVSKISKANIDDLRKNLKKINGTLSSLGLSEKSLASAANKTGNIIVGAAFVPLMLDDAASKKHQSLADGLELWNGLSRLNAMLPIGAPISRPRITSTYGARIDPIDKKTTQTHKGIDFAGEIGTPLSAVAPGRVISAGERIGYGKTVEIDHGLGFTTLYAHLSKINVSRGDWVQSGAVVGLGGSSGRSTGPHLHYEIRYNGNPFNPSNFAKE
jgi:murein DD-endopeptidase MepM/ murein hydrolase activator NlpD